MARLDIPRLNSELRRLRHSSRRDQAGEFPGVNMLRDLLVTLSDQTERFVVLGLLVSEQKINGDFEGALATAKTRLAEVDDIPSRVSVARALLDVGHNSEAMAEFKKAFERAVESKVLVNYAFGELMRGAISVSEPKTIDQYAEKFVGFGSMKCGEDCALESDWLDAAEALGARRELIAEVLRRAEG